jgi:hypothetical protein
MLTARFVHVCFPQKAAWVAAAGDCAHKLRTAGFSHDAETLQQNAEIEGEFPRKTRGELTISSKLRAKSTNLRCPGVWGRSNHSGGIMHFRLCHSDGKLQEQLQSGMEWNSTRDHENATADPSLHSG